MTLRLLPEERMSCKSGPPLFCLLFFHTQPGIVRLRLIIILPLLFLSPSSSSHADGSAGIPHPPNMYAMESGPTGKQSLLSLNQTAPFLLLLLPCSYICPVMLYIRPSPPPAGKPDSGDDNDCCFSFSLSPKGNDNDGGCKETLKRGRRDGARLGNWGGRGEIGPLNFWPLLVLCLAASAFFFFFFLPR